MASTMEAFVFNVFYYVYTIIYYNHYVFIYQICYKVAMAIAYNVNVKNKISQHYLM